MSGKRKVSAKLHYKLLASIVQLMLGTGLSGAKIRQYVSSELERSSKREARLLKGARTKHHQLDDVAAQLLRIWHRDDRYLGGEESKPRALPLDRGRGNLKSIISSINPDVDAAAVLKSMIAVGLIRRTAKGRYLPTASATLIPCMHPWALEHTERSMIRLISTIARNASGKSDLAPLLERYSYVPDLNPAEAAAFAQFSRVQGQAYLDTLDDWLEQRRAYPKRSRGNARGVAAGVHVIAYLGEARGLSIDSSPRPRSKKIVERAKSISVLQPTSPP